MSYFAFLAEHGTTLLLGTVTTIKVLANPAKMLERAGEYGYDKAQLPPADMTTEWACSTK